MVLAGQHLGVGLPLVRVVAAVAAVALGQWGLQAAPARRLRLPHPEPGPRAGRTAGAALEKLPAAGGYPRPNLTHRPSGGRETAASPTCKV